MGRRRSTIDSDSIDTLGKVLNVSNKGEARLIPRNVVGCALGINNHAACDGCIVLQGDVHKCRGWNGGDGGDS